MLKQPDGTRTISTPPNCLTTGVHEWLLVTVGIETSVGGVMVGIVGVIVACLGVLVRVGVNVIVGVGVGRGAGEVGDVAAAGSENRAAG